MFTIPTRLSPVCVCLDGPDHVDRAGSPLTYDVEIGDMLSPTKEENPEKTTMNWPNCLYVNNLHPSITEADLTKLFERKLVCKVSKVHITKALVDGRTIAFVYLIYWELDKLTEQMYNRLAENRYVDFACRPAVFTRDMLSPPPLRVKLAQNKNQRK
jgi:hypothetical protein